MITTIGPPPENMLKATPVLRVLISLMPRNRSCSLEARDLRAHDRLGDLIGDDDRHRDERGAQRRPARAHPASIRLDEHPAADRQHEDRDDRAEVDRAELQAQAAEDPQVRVRDVAQEVQHGVERARVRHAHAEGEDPGHDDRGEDDQRVDADQRRRGSRRSARAPPSAPTTASMPRPSAARTPPRSSASSPRAVDPPGEVTPRRRASVSVWVSSAAVPAMVSAHQCGGLGRRHAVTDRGVGPGLGQQRPVGGPDAGDRAGRRRSAVSGTSTTVPTRANSALTSSAPGLVGLRRTASTPWRTATGDVRLHAEDGRVRVGGLDARRPRVPPRIETTIPSAASPISRATASSCAGLWARITRSARSTTSRLESASPPSSSTSGAARPEPLSRAEHGIAPAARERAGHVA